jgi:hypothetical protein
MRFRRMFAIGGLFVAFPWAMAACAYFWVIGLGAKIVAGIFCVVGIVGICYFVSMPKYWPNKCLNRGNLPKPRDTARGKEYHSYPHPDNTDNLTVLRCPRCEYWYAVNRFEDTSHP